MIGIERGGQKVRIAKLKVSGCFLRTHCFVLHISMCHLICLRRIREDWKLDPAWILVLVNGVLHYSLLRLAESDLQLVHGSKLGYWGQWSKERFLYFIAFVYQSARRTFSKPISFHTTCVFKVTQSFEVSTGSKSFFSRSSELLGLGLRNWKSLDAS